MVLIVLFMILGHVHAQDTIICYYGALGLECSEYNGGDYDVYSYPEEWDYQESKINYTESEGINSFEDFEDSEIEEVSALIFEPEPSPYEWWKFLPRK